MLQGAYAGERAAANAYWGHGRSLFVRDPVEKREILKIYDEELHHRQRIDAMLDDCGASPDRAKDILMNSIGLIIGFLCLFGGWFIPMYGAGKLESENMVEYETAARLAFLSGKVHLVDELLNFAEVEWDHELYFRTKAQSHWLYKFFPKWPEPGTRESMTVNFQEFVQHVSKKG